MSRPLKYDQVEDHKPFLWKKGKSWYLQCCDCGLVHNVKIEDAGGDHRITFTRNKRQTAQQRRLRKGKR